MKEEMELIDSYFNGSFVGQYFVVPISDLANFIKVYQLGE